ncbi:MAG: IS21 family transposase, partial [Pseudomonadales bacterium]|nr:IS21 family transposase [Pseudomonadales bacterium]
MITDQQVKLLMSLINAGKTLSIAAVKAGMSEPTARKYRRLKKLPNEMKQPRTYRTREDPFASVWSEIEEMLELDAGLQAKTVFEELQRRHADRFTPGQLRTLQRRFRTWRAHQGPPKEVFFPQVHTPGAQCQSDFTDMKPLGVTIRGEPYVHLCYHFVLTYSNWEWAVPVPSESFEALIEGLQSSLWQLGAVPVEHRTDNLSAATHDLGAGGRIFNERYLEVLSHYRLSASKNSPGKANENGDVESSHHHFKRAVDQRLRLRSSREFDSRAAYLRFLESVVIDRNSRRTQRLAEEMAVMRALPERPLPACRDEFATVTRWSTVRIGKKPYSVPSRLRGERLHVRLYATRVELLHQGEVVANYDRLGRDEPHRIDYRHLIHSLVKKPGAFARYVYREALFPSLIFRRAYDALCDQMAHGADLEYLRILHLAATTMESKVAEALERLLDDAQLPRFEQVREAVTLERIEHPA